MDLFLFLVSRTPVRYDCCGGNACQRYSYGKPLLCVVREASRETVGMPKKGYMSLSCQWSKKRNKEKKALSLGERRKANVYLTNLWPALPFKLRSHVQWYSMDESRTAIVMPLAGLRVMTICD